MYLYRLLNYLKTTHSYHLVTSTPWPLLRAFTVFIFTVSLMYCIQRLTYSDCGWSLFLPVFHLNLTSMMGSSNSILAVSPLPALPTKSATVQWAFSMSTLLLPYLALAQSFLVLTAILIFSLFFFLNSGQTNTLLIKTQESFKTLPLPNKIFLITFTFLVAIPNKIYINNSIKPLSMFFIVFIFLLFGYIYPFIYCIYIVYLIFTLESFIFGVLYEYLPSFRNIINKLLFNSFTNDDTLAREFLEFFWGNMFSAARKLGPALVAAGGTTAATIAQRTQEISTRDQAAHNYVTRQIEIDKSNGVTRPKDYYNTIYTTFQEEWEKKNGAVLWLENMLRPNKPDPNIAAKLSSTTDKSLKELAGSQKPSATSPITSDWFFDWF